MHLFTIAFIVILATLYPQVIWNYPMWELPDGWTNDIWFFNGIYGAVLSLSCSTPYTSCDGNLTSGRDSVLIPADCDSIILHADQTYYLSREGDGWPCIYVDYKYDSSWMYAWFKSGPGQSTLDLHVSVPVEHSKYLSIRFQGLVYVESGGSAHITWAFEDLTLTLWRDGSAIEVRSWGQVKTEFQ